MGKRINEPARRQGRQGKGRTGGKEEKEKKKNLCSTSPLIDLGGGLGIFVALFQDPLSGVFFKNLQSSLMYIVGVEELEELVIVA